MNTLDELYDYYVDLYRVEFLHKPLTYKKDWAGKLDELKRAIKALEVLSQIPTANNSTLSANTGPVTGNTPRMGSLADDLLNDEDLSDVEPY